MGGQASWRVVFGVAAGPRIGFGHLVRSRSLARVLGVPSVVAIRGTSATRRRAASRGWHVVDVSCDADVRRLNPHLLVIDDPSINAVRTWMRRAKRLDLPAATIHDLGLAAVPSDLVIDGTIAPQRAVRGRHDTLHGPAYAILDPAIQKLRGPRSSAKPRRVLIALGGGRTAALAARLARAISARIDDVDLCVAGGFIAARQTRAPGSGRWIDSRDGLALELSTASVAIVGGGVTLYEACALGVPGIALALTPAQEVTIRGIARRGAALDGGAVYAPVTAGACRERPSDRIVGEVARLLGEPATRRRLAQAGRRLLDGRGAFRVAESLRCLAARHGVVEADEVDHVA